MHLGKAKVGHTETHCLSSRCLEWRIHRDGLYLNSRYADHSGQLLSQVLRRESDRDVQRAQSFRRDLTCLYSITASTTDQILCEPRLH